MQPLPDVNNEVWYTYVSSGANNTWEITPQGLTDPEIVVYTGGCPGDPLGVQQICNTSAGTNVLNTNWGISAGTQVWIGVMSNQGTEGGFDLCVSSSPPDPTAGNICSEAIPVCDVGPTYSFDMNNYSTSGAVPDCFGGTVNNDIWIQFTVYQSGDIEWDATPTTAGVELDWALYDITGGCPTAPGGNPANPWTPNTLMCNYNYDSGSSASAGMNSGTACATCPTIGSPNNGPCGEFCGAYSVTAGNTYAIIIDYFAGAAGVLDFQFTGGTTALISPVVDFSINPASPVCATSTTVVITDNSIGNPEWDFGDGTTYSGNNPPDHTYSTPGTYAITAQITDPASGCTSIQTEFVELYGPLTTTPTPTLETCAGDCDGNISLATSGGSGIYTYAWDVGGSTGPTNDNLCAGNYEVTITDATCGPLVQTVTLGTGPTCVNPCFMSQLNVTSTACNNNEFMVYGNVSFTDPPTTGTLVVTANDGTTAYDTIINPPFSAPLNWSISGIPTGGGAFTVVAEFSADPSCTLSLTGTAPNNCDCSAYVGTFTNDLDGTPAANVIQLCFGETFTTSSNGDWIPPGEALAPDIQTATGDPTTSYAPDIGYFVYSVLHRLPPYRVTWRPMITSTMTLALKG